MKIQNYIKSLLCGTCKVLKTKLLNFSLFMLTKQCVCSWVGGVLLCWEGQFALIVQFLIATVSH